MNEAQMLQRLADLHRELVRLHAEIGELL